MAATGNTEYTVHVLPTALRGRCQHPIFTGADRGPRGLRSVTPADTAKNRTPSVTAVPPAKNNSKQGEKRRAMQRDGRTGRSETGARGPPARAAQRGRLSPHKPQTCLSGQPSRTFLQDPGVYRESLTFPTTKTRRDSGRNAKGHMKGEAHVLTIKRYFYSGEKENHPRFPGADAARFCFKMRGESCPPPTQAR